VVKLVQDQEKQVSVILAVFIEECLVEQQPGSRTTLHARGLRLLAELNPKSFSEMAPFWLPFALQRSEPRG
jgi:hypothetical protein